VTIRPGGPQSNERALLTSGKVEFLMAGNLDPAFYAVKEGIPTKVVAAVMQKDPQVSSRTRASASTPGSR
jgi:NitT/TauT family transport system substrate-binding protein